MKKYISLIKASMNEGMNIFKVSTKNKSVATKILLPIILTLCIMGAMYSYSDMIISKLHEVNMDFVVLTIFVVVTSILTLVEGIYKSGNLLFKCKDDNLLLSMPIKKSVILFVRILKFYLFELAYNSLFIIPAMIAYAIYMKPDITYYIVSLIGLLLFPIIPILISCIIGTIITFLASKFRGKNIAQTVITILVLLAVIYLSANIQNLLTDIANNASNINDIITKIYYPAGAYIELVNNFSVLKLLEFIVVNLAIFGATIFLIGKVYFSINSKTKSIIKNKNNKPYKIKTNSPIKSLIKKEFSRFINSPVFVTNAGFGLVLYILCCIILTTNFDDIINSIIEKEPTITIDYIMRLYAYTIICIN